MKRSLFLCLFVVVGTLLVSRAQAALMTDPSQLLSGNTTMHFNDFENVYDSNGNLLNVTNPNAPGFQPIAAGDHIQGLFVVDSLSNASGNVYSPDVNQLYPSILPKPPNAIEATGVFDTYITTDTAGELIFTPDNSSAAGTAFQAAYGTGAMIAFYTNNSDNMKLNDPQNSLSGLTYAQAVTLATTNTVAAPGTFWGSFGQGAGQTMAPNPYAGGPTSADYYWGANNTAPGVASFAASLGVVDPPAGVDPSLLNPIGQLPSSNTGLPPNYFTDILNPFVIQGTTNPTPSGNNLVGTAFDVYSTDPAALDLLPEPGSILIMGGLFSIFALAVYRRRKVNA